MFPYPPSGATKERLGASVLRGHDAEAEGEDERRRAAREDEEAPEGSRPPTQTHPEPRRPPRLSVAARPVLPASALSRFGISMFRTLSCMNQTEGADPRRSSMRVLGVVRLQLPSLSILLHNYHRSCMVVSRLGFFFFRYSRTNLQDVSYRGNHSNHLVPV